MPPVRDFEEFSATRERQNRLLLAHADRTVKRIISADSAAYSDGALDARTKEIAALAASLALRCDDCVAYHLGRCRELGVETGGVMEAMGIACLIGGTITIPHLRRAVEMWDGMEKRADESPSSTGSSPAPPGESPGQLQSVCDLLREAVPHFDWVGFYLVDPIEDGVLRLGPFSGKPTEHVRIPFGRGVCGQAASTGMTVSVEDVAAEANYLSCSPSVRSEIVVPVFHQGRLVGELDVDSDTPSAFSPEDRTFLEQIASVCSAAVMLAASASQGV